ncbi:DUF2750 domain-containing protein [Massilia agilis]|uniref:DUF2750 domain-containing protein n=1 Tax=Massilia agilis TaxID=1811226 RepID=A0ABT2DEY1_9BURK|nr:DUF2750 domain-containing protein [Massilia agilis]MCS0808983.1 DUF2750 domain-containing protein [Massilia agilis]
MHPKQLAAVFALPASERFEHFVKVVADREKAWGLYRDGWAMAGTDGGRSVLPVWPYKEYAEACAVRNWTGCEPKEISLDDLMTVVLPQLKAEGSLLGVLPTPEGHGATPPIDEVIAALVEELKRY